MKQPLMPAQSGLPPAQAEALYETVPDLASLSRLAAGDAAAWPGEDWDDDGDALLSARVLRPLPTASSSQMPFRLSVRH